MQLTFDSDYTTESGELGVGGLSDGDVLIDDFIAFVDNGMVSIRELSKSKGKEAEWSDDV